MSNIQASSSSSSSISQTYNASQDVKSSVDTHFSVSKSATPAPVSEAVTPVPPSVSSTTPNPETPNPDGETSHQRNGESSYTVAIENLRARINKRSAKMRRTLEEQEAMAQTALRLVSACTNRVITFYNVVFW